jgi:hypothetical protein
MMMMMILDDVDDNLICESLLIMPHGFSHYPCIYIDIIGNALKEESRLDEAINAYRAALHLKADHPHAYNNLGGTR